MNSSTSASMARAAAVERADGVDAGRGDELGRGGGDVAALLLDGDEVGLHALATLGVAGLGDLGARQRGKVAGGAVDAARLRLGGGGGDGRDLDRLQLLLELERGIVERGRVHGGVRGDERADALIGEGVDEREDVGALDRSEEVENELARELLGVLHGLDEGLARVGADRLEHAVAGVDNGGIELLNCATASVICVCLGTLDLLGARLHVGGEDDEIARRAIDLSRQSRWRAP
jgi:hypothetical protein